MKKLILFVVAIFVNYSLYAAPPYRLAPRQENTQTCVKITSHTWTAVPTTVLNGRQDLWFANGSTDTYVGTTDNTVSVSTGVTPIVLPAQSMLNLALTDDVTTYFRSLGNGEGNVCSDEFTYR